MASVKELKERRASKQEELVALQEKVESEDRAYTEEEDDKFDTLEQDIAQLDKRIKRAEKATETMALDDDDTDDDGDTRGDKRDIDIRVGKETAEKAAERADGGFKTPREFCLSVMQTYQRGRITDERLEERAVGSDEQSTFNDAYGGFLVPEAWEPDMMTLSPEGDPMGGRVTRLPMSSPTVKFPARVDKDHSNSVTGGIRAYRRAEADTVSSSRMTVEQIQYNAEPLMAIAYATNELLTDSPISFAALIEQGMNQEITSKTIDERMNGTGVGQFTGILNAACTISEDRDTADQISGDDVLQMRMQAWNYGNCIWMTNHDCLVQLVNAHITLSNEDFAVYKPSDREDVPDTILGRPVVYSEYVPALGSKGDLTLANWGEYLEGLYQSPKTDSSVHVRFENNEKAFKIVARNDGAPWWTSSLTPKNGSNNLSPFVVLAA